MFESWFYIILFGVGGMVGTILSDIVLKNPRNEILTKGIFIGVFIVKDEAGDLRIIEEVEKLAQNMIELNWLELI